MFKNALRRADAHCVAILARFEELRRHPGARFLAFDELGTAAVPMPEDLAIDTTSVISRGDPLDTLSSTSLGAAVVAWESARRTGTGSARIELGDGSGPQWLEVFDFLEPYGCFVGVTIPDESEAPQRPEPTTFESRRAEYRTNASAKVLWFGPEFAVMFGVDEEFLGQSALTLVHPDDREEGIASWIALLEVPGTAVRSRARFKRRDGSWSWFEITYANHLGDAGEPHVAVEIVDISHEIEAQAALQRRETMLDRLYRALPTGVLVLDADGSIAAENGRWLRLLAVDAGTGVEGLLRRVADRDTIEAAIDDAIDNGIDHDLVIDIVGSDFARHGDLHVRPISERGEYVGLLVTLDDTTSSRTLEAELAERMRRDPLTGALNRRGLGDAFSELFREDVAVSVLFIDLDDFKSVNDRLGHHEGDRLLVSVVERIERHLPRSSAVVARLGGDEFLVVSDEPGDIDHVERGVRGDVAELRREFRVGDGFGISFGRAERREGDDFDSLVARADAAMYSAKPQRRRRGDWPADDDRHAVAIGPDAAGPSLADMSGTVHCESG